jgi:hypothetical protein
VQLLLYAFVPGQLAGTALCLSEKLVHGVVTPGQICRPSSLLAGLVLVIGESLA